MVDDVAAGGGYGVGGLAAAVENVGDVGVVDGEVARAREKWLVGVVRAGWFCWQFGFFGFHFFFVFFVIDQSFKFCCVCLI